MLRLIGVMWILDCGAAMFWALGRMRRAGRMPVRGINGLRGENRDAMAPDRS